MFGEQAQKKQEDRSQVLIRLAIVGILLVLSLPLTFGYFDFLIFGIQHSGSFIPARMNLVAALPGILALVSGWTLTWGVVSGAVGLIVASIRGYTDKTSFVLGWVSGKTRKLSLNSFALRCFTLTVAIHLFVSVVAVVQAVVSASF